MATITVLGKYKFHLGHNLAKRAGSQVVKAETNDVDATPLVAKLSRDLGVLRAEFDVLLHFRTRRGDSSKEFVVTVKEFLEDYDGNGTHALVMERGETARGTLAEQFESLDRQGVLQQATVAKAILDTANFIAECGIVWGDVKPGNLVLFKIPGPRGISSPVRALSHHHNPALSQADTSLLSKPSTLTPPAAMAPTCTPQTIWS